MQKQQQSPGILLAASYSLCVHAFDLASCQLIEEFQIGNSQANRVVTVENEPNFFIGAYSSIIGYDINSKSKKYNIIYNGHEGNVTDIVVTPEQIYSCSEDKRINMWDRRTPTKPQVSILTKSSLNSIILMPSKTSVVVCDEDGVVSLWDMRTQRRLQSTDATKIPVRSLAISPNGESFVAAAQDGITKCYSIEGDSFKENYTIQSHNETQLRCAVSPNGKYFATSAADNSARIWALDTGDMRQSLMSGESQEWTWDVAFTKDSQYICTGGSDCTCRLWDVENGRMIQQMPQLDRCVSAIAIMSLY